MYFQLLNNYYLSYFSKKIKDFSILKLNFNFSDSMIMFYLFEMLQGNN